MLENYNDLKNVDFNKLIIEIAMKVDNSLLNSVKSIKDMLEDYIMHDSTTIREWIVNSEKIYSIPFSCN